jgi:PAS domain S-box-containing protein
MSATVKEANQQVFVLLDGQRRVLEQIATGVPLKEILETLVRLIEAQAEGMRCVVLLADPSQQRLTFAAGPGIPEDYKADMQPYLRIAPDLGSCGTAAFLRKPVYVRDTSTDPRWKPCREVAVRHGFHAVWSTPILSDDNTLLGTFGMLYSEPRLPSAEDIKLMEMATQMARVAIQSKQDEERLRASEEKFRLIAENARDLILLTDTGGRRLYQSPSYQSLYENPAGLIGKSIFDALLPEDRVQLERDFKDMVTTGVGRRSDVRVRGKNGDTRLVQAEASPIRDGTGRVTSILSVGRDVTEERGTQEALREREELLRTLVEHAPGGIGISDLHHKLVRTNPAFAAFTGYTEAELQGKSIADLTHEGDRALTRQLLEELLAGKRERVEIEKRYRRKDGRIIWGRATVALACGPNGEPRYTVGSIEDITQRREAQQALERSAQELQALSRRLVDVQEAERRELARELHDRVGQGLTALAVNLKLLRGSIGTDGAAANARLDDSTALLESTAETIENVTSELRPPMLDDAGLFYALSWYGEQFSRWTGIAVTVTSARPDERVDGQAEIALFRIAQEALNNVLKHAAASRVEIVLERSPDACVMTISDDGVGLDASQGSSGSKRPGLGMVTMRERAQAVGGRFSCKSDERGTRLKVVIPC